MRSRSLSRQLASSGAEYPLRRVYKMKSDGMVLRVTSRTCADTLGTFRSAQFGRINGRSERCSRVNRETSGYSFLERDAARI
jgi:hypothetical protein